MSKAKLASVHLTLRQPEDCCGRVEEEEQYLSVETYDGGGGQYIVLKTERWALDYEQINALALRLQEVLRSIETGQ